MSDDLVFELALDEEGEGTGTEATRSSRNKTENENQRKRIWDRSDTIIVQGELLETVHGQLDSEDGEPASLLVFDFRVQFLSNSNSRRIKKVRIDLVFRDEGGNADEGPDVIKVAPVGSNAYYVTAKQVELKHGVNASASGGAGPASLSAGYSLERATSQSVQDAIKVTGAARYSSARTSGESDAVRWVLLENASQKTGVPTHLRALVLLQRQKHQVDAKFIATVDIQAEVDMNLGAKLKKFIGKKDINDPINFDPRPEAQPRKLVWAKDNKIDGNELGSLDLSSYQQVATTERLSS